VLIEHITIFKTDFILSNLCVTNAVAGWAQHQFDTHLFRKSKNVERQWSLFATKDIAFKVQRDDNNAQWMENLHFELTGNGFGYPVSDILPFNFANVFNSCRVNTNSARD